MAGVREQWARLRGFGAREDSPRLADESRWYTERTALLISTLKWALLGAAAGVCVGLGTRVFLWSLDRSGDWARALTIWAPPLATSVALLCAFALAALLNECIS